MQSDLAGLLSLQDDARKEQLLHELRQELAQLQNKNRHYQELAARIPQQQQQLAQLRLSAEHAAANRAAHNGVAHDEMSELRRQQAALKQARRLSLILNQDQAANIESIAKTLRYRDEQKEYLAVSKVTLTDYSNELEAQLQSLLQKKRRHQQEASLKLEHLKQLESQVSSIEAEMAAVCAQTQDQERFAVLQELAALEERKLALKAAGAGLQPRSEREVTLQLGEQMRLMRNEISELSGEIDRVKQLSCHFQRQGESQASLVQLILGQIKALRKSSADLSNEQIIAKTLREEMARESQCLMAQNNILGGQLSAMEEKRVQLQQLNQKLLFEYESLMREEGSRRERLKERLRKTREKLFDSGSTLSGSLLCL